MRRYTKTSSETNQCNDGESEQGQTEIPIENLQIATKVLFALEQNVGYDPFSEGIMWSAAQLSKITEMRKKEIYYAKLKDDQVLELMAFMKKIYANQPIYTGAEAMCKTFAEAVISDGWKKDAK